MKTTVLGCLPYLNLRPLIRSLETNPPEGYTLVYDVPSGLACQLAEARCDIAAVSSFEALRSPDLVIVPGVSIASDGPVMSVLLFSNVPFNRIRTLALDTSSLTGAALSRILLAERYACLPEVVRLHPNPQQMLAGADACMLIGNNAMTLAPQCPYRMDLGQEWKNHTGLPFVFGVWAARQGRVDDRDVAILNQAAHHGMSCLDEIVREETLRLGLPAAFVRNYLAEVMVYSLGQSELRGLEEFRKRAVSHQLLPESSALRLYQAPELIP